MILSSCDYTVPQEDEDNCVCNINQHRQDVFYTDPDIISDFRLYVSRLLNHVNPLTNIGLSSNVTVGH